MPTTPRRRSLILAAVFLGAAFGLVGDRTARGQQPRPPGNQPSPHTLWKNDLKPDQVRDALEKLHPGIGGGIPKELEPFLEMAKKELQRRGFDEKSADAWARFAFSQPEFRRQLSDELQKRKAGGEPKLDTDDVGKMLPGLDPKTVPKTPPKDFPKDFKFDLKDFGKSGPKDAPKFNSKDGPPPGTVPDRPKPGDGKNPPLDTKLPDPKQPALPPEGSLPPPTPPGKTQPGTTPSRPANPPLPPEGFRTDPGRPGTPPGKGDRENPFSEPFTPPPESGKEKATRAMASLWEKNVGPLDETPALKRALFDLVDATDDIKDENGNNFWDALRNEAGDSGSLGDWFKGANFGEGWTLGSLDLGMSDTRFGRWWNSSSGSGNSSSWWSGRTPRAPDVPRTGGGFNIGIPGLEGTVWPVVILAAVLLGALAVWRFWYLRDPRAEVGFAGADLGRWPVDPRRIASREDLVKAFEYLSVLICGPAAKNWTHGTIAEALTELARTHAETALMLARLYELARYAPLDEPLTTAELAEARRIICHLAGVTE